MNRHWSIMKKRNAARSFFLGIRLTLVTLIASSSALPVATSSANSTSYDAKGGFEIVARYPHDPLAFTQGL
ncbi:MAG TPA: hypothetical protein VEZ90_07120, partial [Blastocatellia bacterium]|nr:hypothetical protein [Blastocatellia bacterium]